MMNPVDIENNQGERRIAPLLQTLITEKML